MTFSPKLIFIVTFLATIGTGLGHGAVQFTDLIPEAYVGPVTGWISFLTFIAMSFLTLATGYAGVGKGPLAGAPTVTEANAIKTQAVAATVAQAGQK